ncbi:MAG: hypothetical protein GKS06_11105 [Acidobacteria bacterium]|nr:hypothetical protein [Acidobacteriota bacterium]
MSIRASCWLTGSALLVLASAAPLWAQQLQARDPAISPDGRYLAFQGIEGGRANLYLHDFETGDLALLTSTDALEGGPAWSPDGESIAFYSNRDGNFDIYTVRMDGTELRRRTDDAAMDLMPSWLSADDLLYVSNRNGDQLRLLHLDSGADELLSVEVEHHNRATLSPSGKELSVGLKRGDDWDLAILDLDGGIKRVLDAGPDRAGSGAWSPDGQTLVYPSRQTGDWDLYSVPAAGGTPVRLTSDPGRELDPTWTVDGGWILFTSNRSGIFRLYRMRPDGSELGPLPVGDDGAR